MNSHTEYLSALFPRWKASPELIKLMDRDFDSVRLETKQIRYVIEQHRRERKGNDPDLATITQRLSNAVAQATYRPPSEVHSPKQDEGELRPLGHWFRHYAKSENRNRLGVEMLDSLEYHEKNKAARVKLLKSFPVAAKGES